MATSDTEERLSSSTPIRPKGSPTSLLFSPAIYKMTPKCYTIAVTESILNGGVIFDSDEPDLENSSAFFNRQRPQSDCTTKSKTLASSTEFRTQSRLNNETRLCWIVLHPRNSSTAISRNQSMLHLAPRRPSLSTGPLTLSLTTPARCTPPANTITPSLSSDKQANLIHYHAESVVLIISLYYWIGYYYYY